ncbi:MAG: hypothetical protein AB7P56_03230 [Nitrososphaeraceae archaeon]
MGKKKKETIRIIKREDANKEDYTFVSNDNILNNINNIKNNNESTTYTKLENKSDDEIIEKKKIYFKKVDNKGRKILGRSMQGHSPVYE